ncbi:very short patch repair endonuclease [Pontibacter harenae]|uniref:very short patch repair endonuclease n=1 Tax=Pontibacter harenae TaxID=2894083 RepID=UPI001E49F813|nr:very short patch repair endonuclease [Pontibacter harenae]MCC9168054.1 very short patch repair endonuclease [Pontibacter harenae]
MPTVKKRKAYKPASLSAPLTAQEKISRYMRGNKAKNTKPEILLRKALWHAGLRGYRIHWPFAPGKPDICYPGRRLAVFVHGCFWHQCPYCKPPLPKTNVGFWQDKFNSNKLRDERYRQLYREAGWQRIVVWECQLYQNLESFLTIMKELHRGVPASWQVAA